MSSDFVSTDDEYEKIKEAVDKNFLIEDLYTNRNLNKKIENPPKPISLRNQSHQEISNNPFSVKVTPEFQKHISRHLSRLLDEIIDDKEVIIKTKKKLKKNCLHYGVKLLCSSKDYLESKTIRKSKCSKKYTVKEDSGESDYEKKAKEVAVTPEWVLSQEETKNWAPNTKGSIEIIKLKPCSKSLKHSKYNISKFRS